MALQPRLGILAQQQHRNHSLDCVDSFAAWVRVRGQSLRNVDASMPNIAALAWYSLIALKPAKQESAPFWLIVAVPPFLIYAMRVAFPDDSFDEHNYHLLTLRLEVTVPEAR